MVRILHCADLHLETSFAALGLPPLIGDNLREQLRATLGGILSEARRLQVDAVTFAGDLFEQSTATPDTARFLTQQFERMGPIRVLIAPGEQDAYSSHSLYALTRWPANVHLYTTPGLEATALSADVTVWGAACPASDPIGWQQQITPQAGATQVLLAHVAESSTAKSALFVVSESALQSANVQLALLGGVHQARLPNADARSLYPGSPQPLAWDVDSVNRGPVLVSIADGRCAFEQIRLRCWRLLDCVVGIDEVQSAEEVARRIEDHLRAQAAQDQRTSVTRVTLSGEPAGDFTLADVRAVLPPEANIVLRRSTSFPYDLEQLALEQTVRGTLVRRVREQLAVINDSKERADLLAALRVALLALEGRKVHLDAI